MSLNPNRGQYQPIASASTSDLHSPSNRPYQDDDTLVDEDEKYSSPSSPLSPNSRHAEHGKLEFAGDAELQDSAGVSYSDGAGATGRSKGRRNFVLALLVSALVIVVLWMFAGAVTQDDPEHTNSVYVAPSTADDDAAGAAVDGLNSGEDDTPEPFHGEGNRPIYSAVPHDPNDPYPIAAGPTKVVVSSYASVFGTFPEAGYGTFAAQPTQATGYGDGTAAAVGGAGAAAGLLSNGTHDYERTVILISLGAFGASYLDGGYNPVLKQGLVAKYMQPTFPTLKFPNHWSMLTGLHAESHGIIGDDFRDPVSGHIFNGSDGGVGSPNSWESRWWLGEPIWATAEKAGIKTATLHFPGPPTALDGTRSTYWYPVMDHYSHVKKLTRIAGWLDYPLSSRPRFMSVYMPEILRQGLKTSPKSKSVNRVLGFVDEWIADLKAIIAERNLTDIVDLVFVSDHGMEAVNDAKAVYLDKILGEEGMAQIERWSENGGVGLWWKDGVDEEALFNTLSAAAAGAHEGALDVYTKATLPEKYHFSHGDRIPPVILVPRVGSFITTSEQHQNVMSGRYTRRGADMYDPSTSDMLGIFITQGPFADSVRARRQARRSKRSTLFGRSHERRGKHASYADRQETEGQVYESMDGFQSVELYGFLASLLGIEKGKWASNNGTDGFWDQYFPSATRVRRAAEPETGRWR